MGNALRSCPPHIDLPNSMLQLHRVIFDVRTRSLRLGKKGRLQLRLKPMELGRALSKTLWI
eukprot:4465901-Amphidinium_carterae.1